MNQLPDSLEEEGPCDSIGASGGKSHLSMRFLRNNAKINQERQKLSKLEQKMPLFELIYLSIARFYQTNSNFSERRDENAKRLYEVIWRNPSFFRQK